MNIPEQYHKVVEERMRENMSWPQYFVSGDSVDKEDFVPAYFEVKGPNGPVSYINPESPRKVPTTMYDFAMEAQSDDFHWCEKWETPFAQRSSPVEITLGNDTERDLKEHEMFWLMKGYIPGTAVNNQTEPLWYKR